MQQLRDFFEEDSLYTVSQRPCLMEKWQLLCHFIPEVINFVSHTIMVENISFKYFFFSIKSIKKWEYVFVLNWMPDI